MPVATSTLATSTLATRRYDPMPLDPILLEVLACPEDKGTLLYFEDEEVLYNPRLRRRYAVRDGVPDMLVDEATAVDDAEHERLLAKADGGGARSTGTGTGTGHENGPEH
jgi:uncharacterized protein YbaR (Trm112 family)